MAQNHPSPGVRKAVFFFGIVLQILFVSFVLFIVTQRRHDVKWPGGFSGPDLALELPVSSTDVIRIFDQLGSTGIEQQRHALHLDSFGFIPSYWLILSLIGCLTTYRKIRIIKVAGIGVIALITIAAAFDYRENAGIMKMLDDYPHEPIDAVITFTRHASSVKWIAIFLAFVLMSFLFVPRRDWMSLVYVCFLFVGVLGLFAIQFNKPLIEYALMVAGLGLGLCGVAFCTKRFFEQF